MSRGSDVQCCKSSHMLSSDFCLKFVSLLHGASRPNFSGHPGRSVRGLRLRASTDLICHSAGTRGICHMKAKALTRSTIRSGAARGQTAPHSAVRRGPDQSKDRVIIIAGVRRGRLDPGQCPARQPIEARGRRLAMGEAVDHEGEGEVEPVVAFAGGEHGGMAAGVGEGFGGQGGEPA